MCHLIPGEDSHSMQSHKSTFYHHSTFFWLQNLERVTPTPPKHCLSWGRPGHPLSPGQRQPGRARVSPLGSEIGGEPQSTTRPQVLQETAGTPAASTADVVGGAASSRLLPRRAGGVEEEEEEKEERGGGGVFRGGEEQVALSAALGSGQLGSGTDTGSAPHRAMGSAGAALPPLLLALGRSVCPLWGGLRALGRSLRGRGAAVPPAAGGGE